MSIDNYTASLMKVFTAQFCQNIGFQSSMNSSLDILTDLMHRYMTDLSQNLKLTATHAGRLHPTVDDVNVVFNNLGVNVQELQDYVSQTVGVPSEVKVPKYPVKRPHKLNFPPPRSREILGRPDYIPPYLPLMHPSKEKVETAADTVDKAKGEKYDFTTSFQSAGSNRMAQNGLDHEENFAPYELDAFNTGLSEMVVISSTSGAMGSTFMDDTIIYPSQQSESADTGDRQSGEPHQKRAKRSLMEKSCHSKKMKRTTDIVNEFHAEGFISHLPVPEPPVQVQPAASLFEIETTVITATPTSKMVEREFVQQIRSPTEHIDDIIESVIKVEDSDSANSSFQSDFSLPSFTPKLKFRNPFPEKKRGGLKSRFGPKSTGARIRPMPFSSQFVGETVASVVAAQSIFSAAQQQQQAMVMLESSSFSNAPSFLSTIASDLSMTSADLSFDQPLDLSRKSDSSEGRKSAEKTESYQITSVASASKGSLKESVAESLVVKPFKISLKPVAVSGGSVEKSKDEKLKKKKEKDKTTGKPLVLKVKKEKKLGLLNNVIQKLHESSLNQTSTTTVPPSSSAATTPKQSQLAPVPIKVEFSPVVKEALPIVQPSLKMTFSKGGSTAVAAADDTIVKKKKKKKKHHDAQPPEPFVEVKKEVISAPSPVPSAPAIPKLKILLKKPSTEGSSKKSDKKRLNVVQMAEEIQPDVPPPRVPSPMPSMLSQFAAERTGPAVTVETIGDHSTYDDVSSHFNLTASPPKSPSLCSQSPTNLPSPAYDLTDTLGGSSPSAFPVNLSSPIHFDSDELITHHLETPPRVTPVKSEKKTPPNTPCSAVSGTSTSAANSGGEQVESEVYICPVCSGAYVEGVEWIACDNCDVWFHFVCVGVVQAPPANENWYCGKCRKFANSNRGAMLVTGKAKKKSAGPAAAGGFGGKKKKAGGKK